MSGKLHLEHRKYTFTLFRMNALLPADRFAQRQPLHWTSSVLPSMLAEMLGIAIGAIGNHNWAVVVRNDGWLLESPAWSLGPIRDRRGVLHADTPLFAMAAFVRTVSRHGEAFRLHYSDGQELAPSALDATAWQRRYAHDDAAAILKCCALAGCHFSNPHDARQSTERHEQLCG
ncbi:MAG: hypothetical protein E6Q40_15660 [Cupriavidus sp.]|nr:MAG: hypothetical protein E6Q40_15660 [Cupriavidus sp.]